jgi:nucleotide-binding universal stress UspA family protein
MTDMSDAATPGASDSDPQGASPHTQSTASDAPAAEEKAEKIFDRVFLVVVDNTPEMPVAVRYACRRALHTGGRVALLHVIDTAEFQHWLGVGQLMEQEARQAAEQLMQKMAGEVYQLSGRIPVLYIREGSRKEEVLKMLREEPGISILVLAAATGGKGPGPLVTALTGKQVNQLRVPVTVVPGKLSNEEIDKIA